MAEASDSVVMRYFLQGDGLVVSKIRAMRAEIIGLDKTVLKANEAQVASAVASSRAATGLMRFGSAAKWTAGIFGVGLAFGLVGTLHRATQFMDEQNVVGKQTEAQLISTGRAAGFNAEQIKLMAESLARSTGQDPLQLQSAENRMLTFMNVRGALFKRAVRDANDLGVAMRIGPEASAKALGFALDNPATGMLRLTRIGVSLSVANKEYIKSLVARGQTEQAQSFILAQVERRYGDSAKMYGDTLPGALGKLKFAIDELLSGSMHPLITAGIATAEALASMTIWISENTAVLSPLKYALLGVAIIGGIWLTQIALTYTWLGLQALATYAAAIATAPYRLALWLTFAANVLMEDGLIATTLALLGYTGEVTLAAVATWALDAAIAFIPLLILAAAVGLYLLYTRVGGFHSAVVAVWSFLTQTWQAVAGALIGPIRTGVAAITRLWSTVYDSFRGVMNRIISLWNATVGQLDLSIIGGPDLHIAPIGARDTAASRTTGARASRVMPTRSVSVAGVTGPRAGMVIGNDPKVIHTHVHLDGKEIATAVTEYQHTAQARR